MPDDGLELWSRIVAQTPDVLDVAHQWAAAARAWETDGGIHDTVRAMTWAAVETVPGADYAGVALIRLPSALTTSAATDELVREIDMIQVLLGEGPGMDPAWDEPVVQVPRWEREGRWPAFGARAAALGVESLLAFQLFITKDHWGVFTLYARSPEAFDAGSRFVGQIVASHLSIALAATHEIVTLTDDASTRDLLGQAKGILMERHNVNAEAAHAMLIATSRSSRMRLTQVASWLAGSAPPRRVDDGGAPA